MIAGLELARELEFIGAGLCGALPTRIILERRHSPDHLGRAIDALKKVRWMDRESLVYFIEQSDEDGSVKIGSGVDPHKRLRSLQVGNRAPLVLLGSVFGGAPLERLVHLVFREERLRGEWFRASRRLLTTVSALDQLVEGREINALGRHTFQSRWSTILADAIRVDRTPQQKEQAMKDLDEAMWSAAKRERKHRRVRTERAGKAAARRAAIAEAEEMEMMRVALGGKTFANGGAS